MKFEIASGSSLTKSDPSIIAGIPNSYNRGSKRGRKMIRSNIISEIFEEKEGKRREGRGWKEGR